MSEEEIKAWLWALKPFKAPSADGLHVVFFQHFWYEVKHTICKEVGNIFETGVIPDYLNQTLVSLIPKCPNPELLGNYRPISLCKSIYKIVSKIIIDHIWPFLDKLISPMQAAFVPGRRGLDNILIAQELIHSIDNKKGKDGFMAIKADLEKAYNRLEWNFIHKFLLAYHFPDHLIKLIISCVSSMSISILFNRGSLDSFNSTCAFVRVTHYPRICLSYAWNT